MRRARWWGVGLVGGGVLLAACSSGSSSHPPPKTTTTTTTAPTPTTAAPTSVTIAVQGPMTGSQASTGQDMLRGAELAAANLNAAGGVVGRRIVISAADDAASASQGVTVAQRAVASHVSGVVGPFNSSVGVAALPVYRNAGIPIVRLTSAASTQGFGVTTQPMQGQIAPVEAQELTGVLHARSVAILYDPSTFTSAIAEQLRQLLGKATVAIPVFRAVDPNGSATNVQHATTTALQAVQAAHPSVTYLAMYGPQAGKVVAAMNGAPAYGRCFVDLAAQGSDFTSAAGARAAACLASGVPSAAQLPSTSAPNFITQYKAKFGTAPGTWGPFAYDSVALLAQAATKAGSWTNSAVAAQLEKIKAYPGVTGSITIEAGTGNRLNPPVVILGISANGVYGVDAAWAAFSGYKGPTTPTTAPPTTLPPTTTRPAPTTTRPAPTTTTTHPPPTTTKPVPPTTTSGGKWTGKTIALGAIFSTTGIAQPYGTSQTEGAQLAVSQINAAGGVNGATVQLSIVDDQSDPNTAASQMSAQASSGVLAVLGPTLTNSTLVADPVANAANVPVLAISNTGNGIVGDCATPCPWSFRASLGDATAIPANVQTYVANSHPTSAVVLTTQSDTLGQQTAQIAVNALQAAGVHTSPPVNVPVAEPALKQAVQAALASSPKVLTITVSSSALAAAIIDDARSVGFTGGILGGNSFNSPATARAAGAAGRRAQSGAAWYLGNHTTANTAFISAFSQKYGRTPDQFAAQAYTGVELLAAAAKGASLGFTNPAADRTALRNSLAGVSLDTPLGSFSFTADHDVSQPVWVVAMGGKGGGYTLVKKVPATHTPSNNHSTTTTAKPTTTTSGGATTTSS